MALIATTLLAGCGGGNGGGDGGTTDGGTDGTDGGGTLSNATFSGTYSCMCLVSNQTLPANLATFGTASPNGNGIYSALTNGNSNGAISGASPSSKGYSVQADGTITMDTINVGGIQTTGRTVVTAQVSAGSIPGICLYLRRSGTYSNATMTGNYHFASLISRTGGVGINSLWTSTSTGPAVANGSGTMTYPTVNRNAAGTQSTNAGGAVPYSISVNGELTISTLGASTVGGITNGGSFAVTSGGTQVNEDPVMVVYIKQGSGMNASAFNGSYWVIGMSSDPTDSGNWLAFHGSVTADGAGNMNYVSTTENFEGAISTPSGPDTYTISADGSLISTDRIGAITQDGEHAFLSGSTDAMGTPMLFIFVRK